MPPSRPAWARFDDLRRGQARAFCATRGEVAAWTTADVVPALAEVERRAAEGSWAFGFVSYEAAPGLDPGLPTRTPQPGLPLVWFGLSDGPTPVPVVAPPTDPQRRPPWFGLRCAWDEPTHAAKVAAVRAAIARGDTYQVNLTTRLTGTIATDPAPASPEPTPPGATPDWYADLALGQRGRFNAYLDLGRFVVGSASPELFVELSGTGGRDALMSPMKGTARRGRTAAEDARIVAELLASPKERAENVMIVDLIRNDLARIAEPGSVAVPALCRAERYETVHQLVSDVTARLRPGVGLVEVFRGLFPCGSITGAPKASTMALIRDLEPAPRGVYCGALGVLAPPSAQATGAPRARFSVAIRTVLLDREEGTASYGTGGGITWSSRAPAEYAELQAKTAVLDARATAYGLIETMRWQPGAGIRLLDRHLARLAASADVLGFSCDEAEVRRAIDAVLARGGAAAPRRVRLVLHREGRCEVTVAPVPAAGDGPVRLAIDDVPVDSRAWWLSHKTTLRAPYDERRARHPQADEVVLVNERGEVTESTICSVLALLDGHWVTPPTASGCLPGVARAALLDGGAISERILTPDDLRRASAIELVNALRGRRPATLVG